MAIFSSPPGSRPGRDIDTHVTSGGPLAAFAPWFPFVQPGDVDGAHLAERSALGVVAVRAGCGPAAIRVVLLGGTWQRRQGRVEKGRGGGRRGVADTESDTKGQKQNEPLENVQEPCEGRNRSA